MTTVDWADFLTAVQIQLTQAVTYAWAHNPRLTITYDLGEYSNNNYSATGTFTTTNADLGVMWRRYPSNGSVNRYLVAKEYEYAETSDFSAFVLTKTNLDEYSIAPHTVTNDNTLPTELGRFDSDGVYRKNSGLYRALVEKYTGRKLHGSSNDGRDASLNSYTVDSYDGGDIQLYGATSELNLGLGGATDLGTGTGHTSSPYFDTGDGLAVQSRAYTSKRDKIW